MSKPRHGGKAQGFDLQEIPCPKPSPLSRHAREVGHPCALAVARVEMLTLGQTVRSNIGAIIIVVIAPTRQP
jgi:hypothetical protein